MICSPLHLIERISHLCDIACDAPRNNIGCQDMGVQRSGVGVQEVDDDEA